MSTSSRRSFLPPLAGLVATAAGLAAGELAAGAVNSWRSTVEAVGTTIIDNVPGAVERWAISTLGTADKPVLIGSTIVALLVIGALLGRVAVRDFFKAAIGVAVLGLIGLAFTAAEHDLAAGMPAIITAIVGIPVLRLLVGAAVGADASPGAVIAEPASDEQLAIDPAAPVMRSGAGNRRTFLALAGGVTAASAVAVVGGRALNARKGAVVDEVRASIASELAQGAAPAPTTTDGVASATERALGLVDNPLPPVPAGADFGIDGLAPFVTPIEDFYRIDTALTVPQVNPADWSLRIHGMVENELTFTYEELLRRADLIEADITLTCVSNEVGGSLMSSARWTGVPLANLLDEAGVDPAADQLVGRSVDDFTAGFPVADATDGRDAIVALLINGEPLPAERGFPARIVVPGLYGYVSATKWLSEIELTTFADFEGYWIRREWDVLAPIKTQSRIDVPKPLQRMPAGPVEVAGVAWSQPIGIERVEVRVDEGDWQEVELAEEVNQDTWRQWRWTWEDATPGNHTLTVRATDANGNTQTEERQPPFPNGATGWMKLLVTINDA